MIEYLQIALDFFKEIWFQLNSRFGLEGTGVFKFLKPYLIQLRDNPLYLGISLATLFLVSYGLKKIRSASRERKHKLHELIEKMEGKHDEDNPTEPELDDEDDTAKPLFKNDEAPSPPYMKTLDDVAEKDIAKEDFEAKLEELGPSEPSSTNNEETGDPEKSVESVSSLLTENELDDEPEVASEDFTTGAIEDTPKPELDMEQPSLSMEPEKEHSSPEKTDSLIDQLEFLRTRLENSYQPLESIDSSTPTEKKIPDYDASESLAKPGRYTSTDVSPEDKKYMDLLESFIFIKDQKKHK